jgi:putative oxidoreductase
MLTWLNFSLLPLLARICLVCMFPFSALDKILHWQDALKQANSSFLPGGPALLILGMLVEFITPVCIILGWHDHLAAFILAGFCIVTALLYHNFWTFPDFWTPGASIARAHFWDFLKNFGLAGGLLLLIIAGTFQPLSSILSHPLAAAPTAAMPQP